MPTLLAPPVSSAVTNIVWRSIPHARHAWDVAYADAVTEVILQKDEESPITYSVSLGQVASSPGDIVLTGHGIYTSTGIYVWTIKATGYEDSTVTVEVVE